MHLDEKRQMKSYLRIVERNNIIFESFMISSYERSCMIFFQIFYIHLRCRFILERSELTSGVRWEAWEIGILLAAFTAAQLAYYSCLPYMFKLSTAAELHLSHLATDFYSILAGVILFQTRVSRKRCQT